MVAIIAKRVVGLYAVEDSYVIASRGFDAILTLKYYAIYARSAFLLRIIQISTLEAEDR